MPICFLGNIYFPKEIKSTSLTTTSKEGFYHAYWHSEGVASLVQEAPRWGVCDTQHRVKTEQEVKIAVVFLLSIFTFI